VHLRKRCTGRRRVEAQQRGPCSPLSLPKRALSAVGPVADIRGESRDVRFLGRADQGLTVRRGRLWTHRRPKRSRKLASPAEGIRLKARRGCLSQDMVPGLQEPSHFRRVVPSTSLFLPRFENIGDAHSFALVLNRSLGSLFRAVSHSPSYGHALVKTVFSVWFIDVLEIRPSQSGDI